MHADATRLFFETWPAWAQDLLYVLALVGILLFVWLVVSEDYRRR